MWTLKEALELIREMQPALVERGWYCALAGGVLNRGMSTHDLDLVLVPMNATRVSTRGIKFVLRAAGMKPFASANRVQEHWRSLGSTDTKHVEVWKLDGKRVDVIITYI